MLDAGPVVTIKLKAVFGKVGEPRPFTTLGCEPDGVILDGEIFRGGEFLFLHDYKAELF
jgi:hypothetical protein